MDPRVGCVARFVLYTEDRGAQCDELVEVFGRTSTGASIVNVNLV